MNCRFAYRPRYPRSSAATGKRLKVPAKTSRNAEVLTRRRRRRADKRPTGRVLKCQKSWGAQASPQQRGSRSYEARRMEIKARTPRPRSAAAARIGRETPPVSGRLCFMFAEALAVAMGLAVAVGDGLAVAAGEGVVISPSSDTVTVAVISGWISQKYE